MVGTLVYKVGPLVAIASYKACVPCPIGSGALSPGMKNLQGTTIDQQPKANDEPTSTVDLVKEPDRA